MPVMTAEAMMLKFRREVGDPLEGVSAAEPDSENLWKNEEIYGYLNEAQHRWAEDTLALQKVFTLAIPANERHVKLPAQILNVRAVQLTGNGQFLDERNLFETDANYRDYGNEPRRFGPIILNDAVRHPRYYSLDVRSGYITFDSTRDEADSVQIYASALPRTNVDSVGIVETSDPTDLRIILHYMKALAYAKQDADVLDLSRATEFENLYRREVVVRKVNFIQRRRRAGTVRYSGC